MARSVTLVDLLLGSYRAVHVDGVAMLQELVLGLGEEVALPAGVLGPVECFAFCLSAARCLAAVGMGGGGPSAGR
jgi:hypothetical protein